MDATKVQELRLYLQNLPKSLPTSDPSTSTTYGRLANFSLDSDWVDQVTADGLGWLDGDLPPELADIEHKNFLLADTFDITSSFFLDILADSTPTSTNSIPHDAVGPGVQGRKGKEVALKPADDEWSKF